MLTDGSGLRQLTDSRRDGFDRDIDPTWTPNGTEIVLSVGGAARVAASFARIPPSCPRQAEREVIGDLHGVGVRPDLFRTADGHVYPTMTAHRECSQVDSSPEDRSCGHR